MTIEVLLMGLLVSLFLASLFAGVPVGFGLGGAAVLTTAVATISDGWIGTASGLDFRVFGLIVNRTYGLMSNWVLVALPMFILMGNFLEKSGLAERLMQSLGHATAKVPGGLGLAVTLIGVLLAASTGIIGASVVLLGMVSLPVMLRAGYSRSFSVGTVCSAGTLGILIPPSIMLIVMADKLALSVGDLFLGAIIPGLLLATLYGTFIVLVAILRPSMAPMPESLAIVPIDGNSSETGDTSIASLVLAIAPTFGLVLLVLGSIFWGIATPTEASGLGAAGAMLLAGLHGKLSFNVLQQTLQSTSQTMGFLFAVFIGASCFSLVLRLLGGDELISQTLDGWQIGDTTKILAILGLVFLLGFFLEWIEITLIILPIVGDVILSMNFSWADGVPMDPSSRPSLVWFCILFAVTLQTSFLTPPVGFALFYVRGVAPQSIRTAEIYRGVLPFIALQLAALGLLLCFPQIVLWLPSIRQ